jgi:hypothetical protein
MNDNEEEMLFQNSTNGGSAKGSDEYTCSGEACGGAKFLSSAFGCSVLLRLCPKCNDALGRDLQEGKSFVSRFLYVQLCSDSCNLHNTGTSFHEKPAHEPVNLQEDSATPPPNLGTAKDDVHVEAEPRPPEAHDEERVEDEGEALSTAVHAVNPPPNQGILRAMLNVLASMGEDDHISVSINDKEIKVKRCDKAVSVQSGTRHFGAVGKERKKLYWYSEYSMIMTQANLYAENCMLSNGDVIAGVWETRCNRPYVALLLCTASSDFQECVLVRASEFRKQFKDVELNLGGKFDSSLIDR